MSSVTLLLSAGFGLLVLAGVPFAFAIAAVVAVSLFVADINPILLPQSFVAGTQSFTLLAIPFFMLAGGLMTAGGLSRRLVDVADVLVRHRTGGMGLVTILAAGIFASISGSAPATTAAIGAIMIPAMVDRGYEKSFATALAVSAGVLAPLIPPSIAFVIWGVIAEQSITRLFTSGILPGVLMAGGMALVVWIYAKRNRIPLQQRASWAEIRRALRQGVWALFAPVIVLGGLYLGVFTPTEAAVVACIYALIIGVFVERRLNWREIPAITADALKVTAIVMAIIAFSNGFGIMVAQEQLSTRLSGWLSENIDQKWQMLAILNIAFFLLAAVMDEIAIMVVLGPMLIAIANAYAIDPVHFGAIIVTNSAIGMAAPPIGYCLFVGMAVSGLSLNRIAVAIWPFIVIMLVVLFMVTYIPAFALLLQPS
ncbi:TRAP transporter large permease [Alcaligenaceae bacterium]|nr:TRAP transporter large permease [Alcaligenaceae bacterium]